MNGVVPPLWIILPSGEKIEMVQTERVGSMLDGAVKVVEGRGYSWEIPAGPAKTRYVAEITDGKWFEYGERVMPNRDPIRFFEMELFRVGDTVWPAGDPVPMVDTIEGRTRH